MLYWWILFKDSSVKNKKKAISHTRTWIKAAGFYFHSSVSLNVDIGPRSADGPQRAGYWALCLREASTMSGVLELAGTVTIFKVLWLFICLFFPPLFCFVWVYVRRNASNELLLWACVQKSCGTQLPNGKQLGLLCCVAEHLLEERNTLEIKDRICVLSYWEKWSFLTHFEKFYCRIQESSVFFSASLLLVHCLLKI